ncbi:phosphoglycerate dehydrogenase [Oceanobacillus profundus]|uniref:D-3-phosphoglycerate dehydrogenase n=1 Tax=Oceanobacillus profundus TaxID=372463 RepID=A0A417YDD2_9BACI|nr:phosphoglycerate dehydrogenase [Oceanobacillus profundus]MBR3117855.1 phosphoglycerate dehydrogenase [Oceanobacillus sp.]PAE28951.1 phosphoglycerate dehydrogenase [Paenibacillus sp. 7884-2]MCM3397409.1 phosphoglycerate dehydrogenase [Oceanobacillus profundus]MDO6448706.1 phosphoglycerate dehydrogenase [Oceanobacillus profundus]RHW30629.1 phosphoglycerate dehydrogenase [Oceanobacillus profundus]
MMFNILISDPLSEDGIGPLREAPNMNLVIETHLSKEELEDRIGEFDALLVRSQTQVTRELINKAKKLKIIGRAGVGVDNIDLDAATENGIIVVNAPNGNTNSAAEHTIAMLMSLSRNIPQAYHALKHKKWDRKKYVGVELKNKTLGVVGLGRIGAEVAFRAKGQRMNVIAYDPFLTKEKADKMGIGYGTLEEVIEQADFITVHTPLMKETRHLINAEAFERMKPGVHIINCARGGIIDEDALYDAIISKKVAGAALDVFEEEPFIDHKLLELPEVVATPHLGASTIEAQEIVAVDVSHDVLSFLNGDVVKNPVNLPSVPSELMHKIEPYFHLAEKLGVFLIDLTKDVAEEINISYSGDLSDMEVAPLTRNTIKGILKRHLGDHVNDVNALYLANKKGIIVNENKTSSTKGFTNLITVEVKSKSGTRKVAGTLLNGFGPRIVKVDEYSIDVTPEGHLVVIQHVDQPGVIGRMGSTIAKHQINIATMQVDRSDIGGNAIMVLTIDKHLETEAMEELKSLEEIKEVTSIDL